MKTAELTCIFSLNGTNLNSNEYFGVTFDSNNPDSYGGFISIFTPATAGPVTTGLFDSDGNVFFTTYLSGSAQPASCTINSGSEPGSFVPLIEVASAKGLTCNIIQTGHDARTNTYNYSLELTVTP